MKQFLFILLLLKTGLCCPSGRRPRPPSNSGNQQLPSFTRIEQPYQPQPPIYPVNPIHPPVNPVYPGYRTTTLITGPLASTLQPAIGKIREIETKTGFGLDKGYEIGKLRLQICSDDNETVCCEIDELRNKGKKNFQPGAVDHFSESTLRGCRNFPLAHLHKLKVQHYGASYIWNGKKVNIHLDNATTLHCPLTSGLNNQQSERIEHGCTKS